MDARKLTEGLLAAANEQGVLDILRSAGLWTDGTAWRDFGGQENNFSTIGNQQAQPEAALVEKLVNSIDAVLTLQCRLAGIDPEGSDAPDSIRAAVAQFFGIRDGNLAELTSKELSEYALRIGLIASGAKRAPNLTVVDLGEGQGPDEFEETFLSIGRANKMKIPFVQGKFNMGGTGVLQFAGRHNLQLVLSRRHPQLAGPSGDWGVTVVRREDPGRNIRSSVYRYLAPNGRILRFDHQGALALRLDGAQGSSGLPTLDWGTVIKLYDYQLPGGLKTNIVFDLFNRISCLMPGVALPIRFYERRAYAGHTLESTMVGLSARLDRDTRDNLEFEPSTHHLRIGEQELVAKVYAFRRKEDGESASAKFRDREGVIFLVNGQAHGHLDKTFFKRKSVNMSYLADDILVLVDASSLDGRAREDLFMNSRDRLRDGTLKREIEKAVEGEIGNHELLKMLRAKRREDALGKKLQDDKALERMLADIIRKSPALSALFITGHRLADPFNTDVGTGSRLEFKGTQFPTFFRLAKGQEERTAHLDQRFRVQLETDAENAYFDRDLQPGTWELTVDGTPVATAILNLLNGVATLSAHLPATARVGTVLSWDGKITDPSRVEPIKFSFSTTIAAPASPSGTTGGNRKPPAEPGGGSRQVPKALTLPPIVSVPMADWGEHGFNRESALAIKADEDGGYDFFVNIDNVHLLHEIKSAPGKNGALRAQYKYGMALFGLALLKYHDVNESEDEDIEQLVRRTSEAFSPFLIPMIHGLSELEDGIELDAVESAEVSEDE